MVAYHPTKREEGIQAGTLKHLFRDEIKKSYEEYVEQVGRDFAESNLRRNARAVLDGTTACWAAPLFAQTAPYSQLSIACADLASGALRWQARLANTGGTTFELSLAADGTLSPPVTGLPPVDARNQGGLLDVSLDPNFASNGLIYWSYAEPREGGSNNTAVARGRFVDAAVPRVENVQVIFHQMPSLESNLHFGGRLVWARDGTLFVTLGERSITEGRMQAQRMDSLLGKIVRINADGAFSFEFQVLYDTPVLLMPGDTVTTTCTFENTSDREVNFGASTDAEMCFNFTSAWPAHALDNPGGAIGESLNACLN